MNALARPIAAAPLWGDICPDAFSEDTHALVWPDRCVDAGTLEYVEDSYSQARDDGDAPTVYARQPDGTALDVTAEVTATLLRRTEDRGLAYPGWLDPEGDLTSSREAEWAEQADHERAESAPWIFH